MVLPGHRNLIADVRGRIEEIKQHHERRLQDVLQSLGKGKKNRRSGESTAYAVGLELQALG